jgi:hypothetical protein
MDITVPESVWRQLEAKQDLADYDRAKLLTELGIDLDAYCHASKHRWADYIEWQPIPGTDNYEPHCRGCQGKPPLGA